MMFVGAVRFSGAVRRRLERRHEILEIQSSLPAISADAQRTIDRSL
jgi:hypothetical protein